jgi:hypothetical protein
VEFVGSGCWLILLGIRISAGVWHLFANGLLSDLVDACAECIMGAPISHSIMERMVSPKSGWGNPVILFQ